MLFVSHDAGGTVPPVLAVAQQLIALDDRVTLLGQPCMRTRAETIGCRFVEAPIADYDRNVVIEQQVATALPAVAGADLGEAVLDLAGANGADVVIVDPNLAGALAAAESLPCPSVVLMHSLYATFVDTWFAEIWPLLADTINATRAHFGLTPCDSWSALFDGHDMIVSPVPAAFDVPTSRALPPQLRSFGFLVPDPSDATGVEFPAGDGPAVLVGMTTTFHPQTEPLLRAAVDALASLVVRAVVTTSGYLPPDAAAPEQVRIVERAPHARLLRDADLMICHGGLGSVAAALAAGVPMVCTPMSRDQALNAARAVELGAAVVAEDASAETLAEHVTHVLDHDSYRTAARALRDASGAEGGASQAAATIHGLAPAGNNGGQ